MILTAINISLSFAESNIGTSYHIGDNILIDEDLRFAYQAFSINLNKDNFFLETGFLMSLARTTNDKAYTDWDSNTGLSVSAGYLFSKIFNDDANRFSVIPCLSATILNLNEDDYTSYEIFQLGIKPILSADILFEKVSIRFSFAPQFNFFNLINSSSEKTFGYYLREKDSDGNDVKDSDGNYTYYLTSSSYKKSSKDINWKSFQYEFSISILFQI